MSFSAIFHVFFSVFAQLTKHNTTRPSLIVNNVQLDYVKTRKHLGVTLSDDGNWHAHILNIPSLASKALGTLKLLKFKLKRATLNPIYLSYLKPVLEYASIVWYNCTAFEKELLEKCNIIIIKSPKRVWGTYCFLHRFLFLFLLSHPNSQSFWDLLFLLRFIFFLSYTIEDFETYCFCSVSYYYSFLQDCFSKTVRIMVW